MSIVVEDKALLSRAVQAKGQARRSLWEKIAENRKKYLPIVHGWREALEADGWSIEKTYGHEPVEHAWSAKKDGFSVQGLARPISNEDGKVCSPEIHIWGPDGLAIAVPDEYTMQGLIERLRWCSFCPAKNVGTVRVAFANRVCESCLPEARKKYEFYGWNR